MSDERKCFAGDLISDAIGKTVRVPFKNGAVSSVVEDVLVGVVHESVLRREDPTRVYTESRYSAEAKVTTLFFHNTKWRPSSIIHGAAPDRGLTVPDETEVTVLR